MKFSTIAFLCLLLCLVVSVHGRYRRDLPRQNEDLPHFDLGQFHGGFREYNLEGCGQEVNECMRMVHQKAQGCIQKLKTMPQMAVCMQKDEVKATSKKFQDSSFAWHKSLDMCLRGEQCSGCAAAATTGETQATDTMKKGHEDGSMMMSQHGQGAPEWVKNNTMCFNDVRAAKQECSQKAMQCERFAHCYGEGPTPTDPQFALWHAKIKHDRVETTKNIKMAMKTLIVCMMAPPM